MGEKETMTGANAAARSGTLDVAASVPAVRLGPEASGSRLADPIPPGAVDVDRAILEAIDDQDRTRPM